MVLGAQPPAVRAEGKSQVATSRLLEQSGSLVSCASCTDTEVYLNVGL